MALGNGLLVHGPGHWAAAVRSRSGDIKVASGKKLALRSCRKLPGLRGLARLVEAFAVIPLARSRLPEARLPVEDIRSVGPMLSVAALSTLMRRRRPGPSAEFAVSLFGLACMLLAMRGSDLASYHGVEHKAIDAYESGVDTAEGVKEHERCGSNLIVPLLAASLGGNLAAKRLLGKEGPLVRAVVSLASAAVAVEVFAWSERHPESGVARALRKPGNMMQRVFVTREPDADQIAVGRAAMEEILRLESIEATG